MSNMQSNKISFTCIGHNELKHIQVLLPELLKISDDVIYVDCESSDGSLDFANTLFGVKVFHRKNNFNLNINKTFAMEQAKNEWIFYIDPDERLTKELCDEILQTIESSNCFAYDLPRRNHFFGVWLKYGGQYPDWQRRLFKKGYAQFPNKHVHEKLQVVGEIGRLNSPLLHFPYLTISQYFKKFDFYSTFEANFLFNEKLIRPSFLNFIIFVIVKPKFRFVRRYFFKLGFLDGMAGFFAALFDAVGIVVRYFKLWEISKGEFNERSAK